MLANGLAEQFCVGTKVSMTSARHGDLIGCAIHELAAGQLFDQVRIGVLLHQADAVLEPGAAVVELRKLLLLDPKPGLRVFQRQNPAIAPDGVGAEICDHCHGDGRNHQGAENARDRTLDSHPPNESHSDSACQQGFR